MKKLLVVLISLSLFFTLSSCVKSSGKVVSEYTGNVSFGDNDAYALGENSDGIPIFKDTNKTLKQAIIDYEDGFNAIKEQFNLKPISKNTFDEYKTYGWQLNTNDENIKKQGEKITQFLDFYENSFQ